MKELGRSLVVTVAAAAACAPGATTSAPPRPAAPVSVDIGPSPEPSDAALGDPAGSAGAPAIARCETSLESAVPLTPAEAFAVISVGCADVFSRAGCRDAWRAAPALPAERRAASLAEACAAAYCASFTAPAPALCAPDVEPPAPSELGPLWAELHARILEADLGSERARRLLARYRAWAEARVWVPPDNEPECHAACCPPSLQGPAPDGTVECCLCD